MRVRCARRGTDVVEQIWVYGNSYESFLVAVVVPNKRELLAWAKEQGGLPSDFAELCATPEASVTPPLPCMWPSRDDHPCGCSGAQQGEQAPAPRSRAACPAQLWSCDMQSSMACFPCAVQERI